MNFSRVGCVALCFFIPSAAGSALACGLKELVLFEEKAQTLEEDAEQFGRKLLDCPFEGREAYQWLVFLGRMRSEKKMINWKIRARNQASNPQKRAEKSNYPSSVESEIDASYAGSYEKLQALIDSGNPNYVRNYEAQIAVARALIRVGRFIEGRLYFDNAIRLGAHHGRFDVERLYTFIWEKNWPLAEREIVRLRFDSDNKELRQGISRAQRLISNLKSNEVSYQGKGQVLGEKRGVFETEISNFNINREYRRYSLTIGWHDVIDMQFGHHLISSLIYEKDTKSMDTLWLGRDAIEYGMLRVGGKIGYRTPANQNRFLFDGHVGLTFLERLMLSISVDRKNLAEFVALPRSSFDLVQDRINGRISWAESITLQSTVAKDWKLPPFSRHRMNLCTPMTIFGRQYGAIYGIFGTEYESRERPSPDYETFRQGLRAYLGGRVENRFDTDTDMNVEIRYQNIHRQGHGMTNWVQNSALTFDLEGLHEVDQRWRLIGRISYNGEETIRPTQPFQNRLEIRLGAHLVR